MELLLATLAAPDGPDVAAKGRHVRFAVPVVLIAGMRKYRHLHDPGVCFNVPATSAYGKQLTLTV
jgi:hypothetical protein